MPSSVSSYTKKLTSASLLRHYAPRLASYAVGQELTEARILLAYCLGVSVSELMKSELKGDYLNDSIDEHMQRVCAQREQGIPIQHIVGKTWFLGQEFMCHPEVFIPRPETELLVQWLLEAIDDKKQQLSRPIRVLDICTGTGIIAICAAQANAQVVAIDYNSRAIEVAKKQKIDQDIPYPITWICADAIAWLNEKYCMDAAIKKTSSEPFDIIVSNPPYIPVNTPVNITVEYDPIDAVFSGSEGLDFICSCIPLLSHALYPEGVVGIEHDASHRIAMMELFTTAGFRQVITHTDYAGYFRYTTACYGFFS